MKLLVISYKTCWLCDASPSGYASDGGFPIQMQALAELFDATTLLLPLAVKPRHVGESSLAGHNLTVVSLSPLSGQDLSRKLRIPLWLLINARTLFREVMRADAIHAPIPGDIGTIGILLALALRKPLFVRHCGNWQRPVTAAERFWRWLLVRIAGGRNVCLATGGAPDPPSSNPALQWIFATSLTKQKLAQYGQVRQAPSADAPRLVIACRQEQEKGTGIVLESLPALLPEFPRLKFDVIGDGSALAAFKAQALALGISGQVVFHGKVTQGEVLRLVRQADLFCFPTRSSEGFPKAVLEALACGVPVITTPVSVLPTLIGRGGGLLLDAATPAALAAAVKYCLSDAERYHAMSARAVATAREFSLERWRTVIGDHLRAAWGELRMSPHTPPSLRRHTGHVIPKPTVQ